MKPETDKSGFDDFIRSSVDRFEVPYDPAQWQRLSDSLNTKPSVSKGNRGKLGTGIIAASVAGIIALLTWIAWPVSDDQKLSEDLDRSSQETMHSPEQYQENTASHSLAPAQNATENATEIPANEFSGDELPPEKVHQPTNSTEVAGSSNAVNQKQPISTRKTADKPIANNALPAGETETVKKNAADKPVVSDPVPSTKPASPTDKSDADFLPGLDIYAPASVCLGTNLTLRSSPGLSDLAHFQWLVNNKPFGTGTEIIIPVKEAGKLTVSLVATNSAGKSRTVRRDINITDHPYAEADYRQIMEGIYKGYPVRFESRMEPDAIVKWTFPDGTTTTEENPMHLFSKTGTHNVQMAVNRGGCTVTKTISVYVEKTFPLGRNHEFTPNNDGAFDLFMPSNLHQYKYPFELEIIDGYNKVVYRTTDVNKPWNGQVNNSGDPLPEGFYKWIVTMTLEDGSRHRINGDVQLSRR